MCDVLILEATQNVDDGVCVTDVSKELVAKTFTLRCTLHKTCDVDNLDGGWHHTLRVVNFGELHKTLVRYGDDTYIWFDCTEWEVRRLRTSIRQTVKEC